MKNILIWGGIVLVVGLGAWWWLQGGPANQARFETYESERYGFSFNVPDGKDIHEYIPEVIAVGAPIEGGFDADAEVLLATGGKADYDNHEDFLFETTRNMCAADGPSGTIYCDQILDLKEFTNKAGVPGFVFYQNRVHENFTDNTKSQDRLGPFYAFDLEAGVSGQDRAVLLVRPAVNLKEGEIDAELVRFIADSVTIE